MIFFDEQHRFDFRRALFFIGDKTLIELCGGNSQFMREFNSTRPEWHIVSVLRAIVVQLRPDLAGCKTVAAEYDIQYAGWKVLVVHESLPEQMLGDALNCVPLYPPPKIASVTVHAGDEGDRMMEFFKG